MNWTGEYVIESTGLIACKEALKIYDPGMVEAYRRNALFQFICESSAIMGVKVGMA